MLYVQQGKYRYKLFEQFDRGQGSKLTYKLKGAKGAEGDLKYGNAFSDNLATVAVNFGRDRVIAVINQGLELLRFEQSSGNITPLQEPKFVYGRSFERLKKGIIFQRGDKDCIVVTEVVSNNQGYTSDFQVLRVEFNDNNLSKLRRVYMSDRNPITAMARPTHLSSFFFTRPGIADSKTGFRAELYRGDVIFARDRAFGHFHATNEGKIQHYQYRTLVDNDNFKGLLSIPETTFVAFLVEWQPPSTSSNKLLHFEYWKVERRASWNSEMIMIRIRSVDSALCRSLRSEGTTW